MSQLNQLRIENYQIKRENIRLANKILEINQKLDEIEQIDMSIGIEIAGVPNTKNENCIITLKETAE